MGPSLTLQARELNMHGAAACLFSAGEKCPGPTPATRLSMHMLQHLGGPSIIVPAWSRPNIPALAVHNWPPPPPSQALSISVTADGPWPEPARPAQQPASQPDGDHGCWTEVKPTRLLPLRPRPTNTSARPPRSTCPSCLGRASKHVPTCTDLVTTPGHYREYRWKHSGAQL